MVEVFTLRNTGATSAAWLWAAGIETFDDLERLGAVAAGRRAKRTHPERVTLNLLYALEGALPGLPWTELPPGVKRRLAEATKSATIDEPATPTPGDEE